MRGQQSPRAEILISVIFLYCGKITDADVSALAHGCPLLVNINLFYCSKITEIGISALAQSCHILDNINLSYCSKITDEGISAIAQEMTAMCYSRYTNISNLLAIIKIDIL